MARALRDGRVADARLTVQSYGKAPAIANAAQRAVQGVVQGAAVMSAPRAGDSW
jgi:hypothetical protein